MSNLQLNEDEMAEVKREAVEKLRPYLSERIIAERHFDYLRSKKILTREDAEEISCQTTSKKKAGALFDCIVQNPKGLDALVESIRKEKTQNFLIEKITDEVQRLKNERLELFKGLSCTVCGPPYEETNDLSRTQSNECNLYASTVLCHPEGESSLLSSASTVCFHSVNLQVMGQGSLINPCVENSPFSSILPRPGDPGAPPLPAELQTEQQEDCTSANESQFLPLRSRSLSPL
ncbi:B-cell lymphoma/leukemia 10 [Microcaecilia unicolor]|uniref:B-cell lymphoma/leukemia 10 n=1 Tax=Microcaecilia unicolor TaxID=1415580 RepID=A0A6P7YBN1_9AMPH|nr:B-cell lymphoma/leukemia 10 [Microcaecilia unicolor]